MNKKLILPILSILFLTGCIDTNINPSEDFNNDNTSTPTETTPNDDGNGNTEGNTGGNDNNTGGNEGGGTSTGGNEGGSTGGTEPPVTTTYTSTTISGANTLCNKIAVSTSDVNKQGEDKVSFKGRLFFAEDCGTTSSKNGYLSTNQYKCFFFDNEDWIYVGVSSTMYAQLSKYEFKDNEYVEIKGTTNKYLGQNEIIADSYTWLGNNSGLSYSFASLASAKSFPENTIDEILTKAKASRLNIKGTNYTDNIVHFKAKYVQKVENAVALFASGSSYIYVHGTSKLNNGFTLGNSYDIYGAINMFIYRPQIEFLYSNVLSEPVTVSGSASESLSGTNLYKVSYTKDTTNHSANYENVFGKMYSFEGYVQYYIKGGYYYTCLSDTNKNYSTYTAAITGKALFINNTSEEKISSESDLTHSLLGSYYNQKVTINYTPYLLNTNYYWQVQIFTESISIVE